MSPLLESLVAGYQQACLATIAAQRETERAQEAQRKAIDAEQDAKVNEQRAERLLRENLIREVRP